MLQRRFRISNDISYLRGIFPSSLSRSRKFFFLLIYLYILRLTLLTSHGMEYVCARAIDELKSEIESSQSHFHFAFADILTVKGAAAFPSFTLRKLILLQTSSIFLLLSLTLSHFGSHLLAFSAPVDEYSERVCSGKTNFSCFSNFS